MDGELLVTPSAAQRHQLVRGELYPVVQAYVRPHARLACVCLAPADVTVEGPLRVDPSAERDRWSAVVDVRSVTWDGGAAAVRETVWLSGRDQPPDAVRGDVVRVGGTDFRYER